jgi:heme exporter protein D
VDNNDMNLFLALFWLVCAAVLLAYEHFLGGAGFYLPVGKYRFSAVWLMLGLTLYNLVRWWLQRAHRAEQRAQEIARARQDWERRRRPSEPLAPPDPNFNFTDEPSPPADRGVTDQPPSKN